MASGTGDDVDAREAFALLGHEIRLDILLALLEDWVAVYTEPKSYTELMEAVDVRDSGKFNYHLEKLRGVYVRQVEDGYVPTASATALYRAVLAHRPTEPLEFSPRPLETPCPNCGATPQLRYDRGFVSIDCDACESWAGFTYPFPRNGLESHAGDDLLEALDSWVRHDLALARTGQCPDCAGSTTADPRTDAIDGDAHWIELTCESCTFVVGIDLLSAVVGDDRVASALRTVGIDPKQDLWELPAEPTRFESRTPLLLAVDVTGETGTVSVVVDETLAVESVTIE